MQTNLWWHKADQWLTENHGEDWLDRDTRELLEMMEMFCILIIVEVTQVSIYLSSNRIPNEHNLFFVNYTSVKLTIIDNQKLLFF